MLRCLPLPSFITPDLLAPGFPSRVRAVFSQPRPVSPWNLKRGQTLSLKTLALILCHQLPSALRESTWAPPLRTLCAPDTQAQTMTGAGAEPGPQRAAVARWVGWDGTPAAGPAQMWLWPLPRQARAPETWAGRPARPQGCGSPSQEHGAPHPHPWASA